MSAEVIKFKKKLSGKDTAIAALTHHMHGVPMFFTAGSVVQPSVVTIWTSRTVLLAFVMFLSVYLDRITPVLYTAHRQPITCQLTGVARREFRHIQPRT